MLVGRPGLCAVMVGRAAELDRLAHLVESAAPPAIALVGGEAGVGKTRLVRELLGTLPDGTAVFAGQADPGSQGRPFELLLDALDVGRLAPLDERLRDLTDRDRPIEERLRVAVELVAERTAEEAAVLVFDDLHWADAESVLLFERLAEPGSGPRLLLGTYRPDALNRRHPAAELLPRLERRHAVAHVHLDRLSVGDVGAFLAAVYGRPPSYRVVEALHARTGGNPFFLEELLAASSGADPDQLVTQPLPWSLGELVRSQLDGLGAQERCVLETAAVLGRRAGFDLLSAVTCYSEEELIPLLRSLVGHGLLVESEPDVFSFRHALSREAIEGDLLGRERRRLHQQALDALTAARSTDLAAVARHAQGAGRLAAMVEAARAGARSALDAGSTYQALQLAELGLSEADDDDEMLRVASKAAWMAGLLADAARHARQRLAAAERRSDLEASAAALRLLCRVHYDAGEAEGTSAATTRLAELVGRLDDGEEKAKAYAALAQMAMLLDDLPTTLRWADASIELAERLGLPDVAVWAQIEKASKLIGTPGHVEEGAALLRSATDQAEALGQWVVVARGLNNLVRGDHYRPEAADARQLLLRMRTATERAGFDLFRGSYWDGLADLAEWEGDLGAALGYIDEALQGGTHLPDDRASFVRSHAAGLYLEAGEVDQAEAMLRTVKPEVGCGLHWWNGLDLHIAARRGDAAGVARSAATLVAEARARGSVDPPLLHDVVRAMLLGGVPAHDVASLVAELPSGAPGEETGDHPYVVLVHAQLAEHLGDGDAALAGYERALEVDGGRLRPAARASAHVGAGRLLAGSGRLADAKAHAAAAGELLAGWGGSRVEELHTLERRLGEGGEVAGPAELTSREREVAALLAEGLTNGALAARLYISPKTASVHVSNILAKLGMTSRSEIAAYAVRSGLAGG